MDKYTRFQENLLLMDTSDLISVCNDNFGLNEVNQFLFECINDKKDIEYVRSELIDWINDSIEEIVR